MIHHIQKRDITTIDKRMPNIELLADVWKFNVKGKLFFSKQQMYPI
jgi:hypothetical protein